MMSWRTEVLDPATMETEDIRAELRHDLSVYDRVQHPLSKAGMARRIEALVAEMDKRTFPEATVRKVDGPHHRT